MVRELGLQARPHPAGAHDTPTADRLEQTEAARNDQRNRRNDLIAANHDSGDDQGGPEEAANQPPARINVSSEEFLHGK